MAAAVVSKRPRNDQEAWLDRAVLRDLLIVAGWALGLRVLFELLTSGTYDPDEFVLLALGNRLAHGQAPYHDFMFFHPPGALVLYGVLQPLIQLWWPLARVLSIMLDSGTAVLVWWIGSRVYGRRGGLVGGLIYGASPLALVTTAHVSQDTLITFFGMAGLAALVTGRTGWRPIVAGICLGVAIWTKYPALIFLPVYILAAPRWWAKTLLSFAGALIVLFAPFASSAHALWEQTVVWQSTRPAMPLEYRVGRLLIYWLALNPLAVIALATGIRRWRVPSQPESSSERWGRESVQRRETAYEHHRFLGPWPVWVATGFGLGLALLLGREEYYHYLAPIVPFAALLAAPSIPPMRRWTRRTLLLGGVAATVLLGALVATPGSGFRQFIGGARLSWVRPVVQTLDRTPSARAGIISDRFEYAYLADVPEVTPYFWNMRGVVDARALERYLPRTSVLVQTVGQGHGFPAGFVRYLQRHGYSAIHTAYANVWIRRARE
jgi:hypothetical protein